MKGKIGKVRWYLGVPLFLLGSSALVGGLYSQVEAKKGAGASPTERADVQTCYGCHAEIKEFHAKGKHKNVNCGVCHGNLQSHMGNPVANKPLTRLEHA
ncbi:MAG: hypothetical protein ACK4K4_06135, partial [Caldimicrobium sp.]